MAGATSVCYHGNLGTLFPLLNYIKVYLFKIWNVDILYPWSWQKKELTFTLLLQTSPYICKSHICGFTDPWFFTLWSSHTHYSSVKQSPLFALLPCVHLSSFAACYKMLERNTRISQPECQRWKATRMLSQAAQFCGPALLRGTVMQKWLPLYSAKLDHLPEPPRVREKCFLILCWILLAALDLFRSVPPFSECKTKEVQVQWSSFRRALDSVANR